MRVEVLPNELWLAVFSFLDWDTLDGSIPMVCRTFYHLFLHTPGAEVNIVFPRAPRYTNVGALCITKTPTEKRQIKTMESTIRSLLKSKTLREISIQLGALGLLLWDYDTFLDTSGLSQLFQKAGLQRVRGTIFASNIHPGNRITRLDLNSAHDCMLAKLLENLPHLRAFTLGKYPGPVSDVGISRLARLTCFELHGASSYIGDAGLTCMIAKSNLRRFVLKESSPGITTKTFDALGARQMSLHHLEIGFRIDCDELSDILRLRGKKLKTLRLLFLPKRCVTALIKGGCPKLETLHMGGTILGKHDVKGVLSACPVLREIQANFFTDTMFAAVATAYPSCVVRTRSPQQAAYSRWREHPGLSLVEDSP